MDRVPVKRFIFTVTTGRSGTAYAARILGMLSGCTAVHEQAPSFHLSFPQARTDPAAARRFLVDEKLPAIAAQKPNPIYIETSHLFCKGFLEPWLAIEGLPTPDLILLDRPLRQVALSMLRLQTVPCRTPAGRDWLVSPEDENCLTAIEGWQTLNDYQLCYWYALEIEARKDHYAQLVAAHGGRSARTSAADLMTFSGLSRLRRALDLPPIAIPMLPVYLAIRWKPTNRKRKKTKYVAHFSAVQIEAFEREVTEATRRA